MKILIRKNNPRSSDHSEYSYSNENFIGCITAHVGPSGSSTKTVEIPNGFECPTTVDKSNWHDGYTWGDTFSVRQMGKILTVTRIDFAGEWGLDLKFGCCNYEGIQTVTNLPDFKSPFLILNT